jgi:hypothetical protein
MPNKKSKTAKNMQALFKGSMSRKVQAFFRKRSPRNRSARMRKNTGMFSGMMKKFDLKRLPDLSNPRTLKNMQKNFRLKYKK